MGPIEPENFALNLINQSIITTNQSKSVFEFWLGKAYAVADVALVVLVVGHELRGSLDIAIVELVVEQSVHCHHY